MTIRGLNPMNMNLIKNCGLQKQLSILLKDLKVNKDDYIAN